MGRRGPYMTNADRKRMESLQEAQEKARKDEEREHRIKEVEERRRAKSEPLELDLRTSDTGAHHCALNDRGKHHRTAPACFTKGHMGACPKCHKPVSVQDGCKGCEIKGKDLRYENLIFPANPRTKPLVQLDRIKGLLPWGAGKSKKVDSSNDKDESVKGGSKKGKKGKK